MRNWFARGRHQHPIKRGFGGTEEAIRQAIGQRGIGGNGGVDGTGIRGGAGGGTGVSGDQGGGRGNYGSGGFLLRVGASSQHTQQRQDNPGRLLFIVDIISSEDGAVADHQRLRYCITSFPLRQVVC